MSVLSKVLYGEIDRTSVDILGPAEEGPEPARPRKKPKKPSLNGKKEQAKGGKTRFVKRKSRVLKAKIRYLGRVVNRDTVGQPGVISLTPKRENIHSFRAKTNCILFDILLPNYDNTLRQCHFFREIDLNLYPMFSLKKLKDSQTMGDLKDGRDPDLVLEEIEEPEEISSFVVVAFPTNLALNL